MFLKAHLFGDIFQRGALNGQERELATIAALAGIEDVNARLQAHKDGWFAHVAVDVPAQGGSSEWLEPVSGEVYLRLP